MKFGLVLAFCVALASARFSDFEEERRRTDDWQSGSGDSEERRRADDWQTDSKDTSCQVGSRKVKTFDGSKLTVSLPNCYTVLAKDCSSEPKFVVLMRKLSQNSDLKEIKIVTPNKKVVLTASEYSNQIKVTVDNKQVPLEKDQDLTLRGFPTIRITKEGQQQVKVDILDQHLQVRFDGYVCDIKSSEQSYKKKCGLCSGLSNSEFQSEYNDKEFLQTPTDGRRLLNKFVTNDCRNSESESKYDEYVPINQRHNKRSSRRQFDEQLFDEDQFNEKRNKRSSRHQSEEHFFDEDQFNEQRNRRSPNRILDDIFEQSADWDSEEIRHRSPRDFSDEIYGQSDKRFSDKIYGQSDKRFSDEIYGQSDKRFSEEIRHRAPRYFSDEIYGQSDKRFSDKLFEDEDHDDFFGGKYESTEQRPVLKHKIVKRGEEICVSLVRIPQCSDNSFPEGKVQKRVPYHCIYSNDPRVWKYESKIRNGEPIPEIQRLTPSMTRTEIIPTKCNNNIF